MTIAVVPTEPATNPVKLLANCTASVGPYGSWVATEPSITNAPASCGSWDRRAVTTSQPFSEPRTISPRLGTSLNCPISR